MPGNIIDLEPQDITRWPAPNYVDPYQRRWMPEYAGVLCGAATLLVMLRLWLRTVKYAGSLGIDDLLLTCGWLCLCCYAALVIIDAEVYYTSRHIWDVPVTNIRMFAKITWLAELVALFTGCFIKISALLFYRRLVDRICTKCWKWAIWIAISFTVAYTLAFVLTLILNCNPTEAYWAAFDPVWASEHVYYCANTQVMNILAGAMASISDLYAVALPCIMLRNVPLPRAPKIALNAVFACGFLVVATSIVRTYYLWEVGHSTDISTAIWNVFVWTDLELSLGIMCTCAPMLGVLVRNYLSSPPSRMKRTLPSTSRSYGHTGLDSEQKIHVPQLDSPLILHRPDSSATHAPVLEIIEPSMISPVSSSPSSPPKTAWDATQPVLVRTPADYEYYNLRTVQKSKELYRESSYQRGLISEEARRYSERLRNYGERSKFYGQLDTESKECELLAMPERSWVKTW